MGFEPMLSASQADVRTDYTTVTIFDRIDTRTFQFAVAKCLRSMRP